MNGQLELQTKLKTFLDTELAKGNCHFEKSEVVIEARYRYRLYFAIPDGIRREEFEETWTRCGERVIED